MNCSRNGLVVLAASVLALVGCGGGEGGADRNAGSNGVRVTITGDDQMKFNKTLIEVPAGAEVTLTLVHIGKLPLSAMGHNFVLLKQGTDVHAFALAAASAIETDYIPARKRDEVIAHTKMLGGGETDTIVFTAPEPGTYTFICSFPGHYMQMQGDLVVR